MYLLDKNLGEPQLRCLEVGTLAHIIAWLEMKRREEVYCYTRLGDCLVGQYVKESGGELRVDYLLNGKTIRSDELPYPYRAIAQPYPHTFGAALSRARALQAKE